MQTKLEVNTKLNHLFKLLDDDSYKIQKILREEILNNALEITLNKEQYSHSLSILARKHYNKIISQLHFELILNAFEQLLEIPMDEIDLEKGFLLISFWDMPDVSCHNLSLQLDQIAERVLVDIPRYGHPLSFIDHINQVLFGEYHFTGNQIDYHNPNNSYLHRILETGQGIPISLSILYMLIAKRLNCPVFGVSMPAHFILKFDNGEDEIFFDPFYEGKVYTRQACLSYLGEIGTDNREEILQGCTNLDILRRVLRNLYYSYSSYDHQPERIAELEKLLSLLDTFRQNSL